MGSKYRIPHGMVNAALLSHVIRYNATDIPFKSAAVPQYEFPHAKQDYADLSDAMGLGGATVDEKVIKLIEAIEELKKKVGIPTSIKAIMEVRGGQAEEYLCGFT